MSHGLRVYNSGGHLQIDSAYRNFRLVQSGSAQSAWGPTSLVGAWPDQSTVVNVIPFNFDVAGDFGGDFVSPLVLLRPPLGVFAWGVILQGYFSDPDKWGFWVSPGYENSQYNPNFTFEYRVYWPIQKLPVSGSHGLIVRDSSANVVFDSREQYFSWLHVEQVQRGYDLDEFYGDSNCGNGPLHSVHTRTFAVPDVGVPWVVLTDAMSAYDSSNAAWGGAVINNGRVDYKAGMIQEAGWGFPAYYSCGGGTLMFGSALI